MVAIDVVQEESVGGDNIHVLLPHHFWRGVEGVRPSTIHQAQDFIFHLYPSSGREPRLEFRHFVFRLKASSDTPQLVFVINNDITTKQVQGIR